MTSVELSRVMNEVTAASEAIKVARSDDGNGAALLAAAKTMNTATSRVLDVYEYLQGTKVEMKEKAKEHGRKMEEREKAVEERERRMEEKEAEMEEVEMGMEERRGDMEDWLGQRRTAMEDWLGERGVEMERGFEERWAVREGEMKRSLEERWAEREVLVEETLAEREERLREKEEQYRELLDELVERDATIAHLQEALEQTRVEFAETQQQLEDAAEKSDIIWTPDTTLDNIPAAYETAVESASLPPEPPSTSLLDPSDPKGSHKSAITLKWSEIGDAFSSSFIVNKARANPNMVRLNAEFWDKSPKDTQRKCFYKHHIGKSGAMKWVDTGKPCPNCAKSRIDCVRFGSEEGVVFITIFEYVRTAAESQPA